MTYKKVPVGEIVTDKDGKAVVKTDFLVGKIIKVRIDYGTAEDLTTLKIFTIEREKVIELMENNNDVVLYPRHSIVHKMFAQIPIKETEPVMDHFVTVGEMIIEVENAGDKKTIKNIIFTLEE